MALREDWKSLPSLNVTSPDILLTARCVLCLIMLRQFFCRTPCHRKIDMFEPQKDKRVTAQPLAVADLRRIQFGAGPAPRFPVKVFDGRTFDIKAVRFGAGSAPVVLR